MSLTSYSDIFVKTIFAMTIVSFLVFSLFGIVIVMNEMKMDNHGAISDCLFMTVTSQCPITFTGHINLWQLMFNTLLPVISLMSVILLAITLTFTKLLFNNNSFTQPLKFLTLRYRLYLKQHPLVSLFDYLKEAFSQGILNPKIYA